MNATNARHDVLRNACKSGVRRRTAAKTDRCTNQGRDLMKHALHNCAAIRACFSTCNFDDERDLDRESFLVKAVNAKQSVTATLLPLSPTR